MEIRLDLTEVYRTSRQGPERLKQSLNKAIQLATVMVWADATNRHNYYEASAGASQQDLFKIHFSRQYNPDTGKREFMERRNALSVRKQAKFGRAQADRLRVITGMLIRSITRKVTREGDQIKGTVGTPLVYGRIHETGGYAGRRRTAYIRPRPYLGPALERQRSKIMDLVGGTLEV